MVVSVRLDLQAGGLGVRGALAWSSWGIERVLDADPWIEPSEGLEVEFSSDSPSDGWWTWNGWTWDEPVPQDWRPTVDDRGEAGVTVSFLAYSGHVPEEIVRHVDRFGAGSYRFHSDRERVAQGLGGFIS